MSRVLRLAAAALAAMLAGAEGLALAERLSFLHGLYCSLGTAATVGCDVTPSGAGRLVSSLLMVTALPLLGAIFAWATAERAHRRGRERHDELRAAQDAVRRITADLHEYVTSQRHPDAPGAGPGTGGEKG